MRAGVIQFPGSNCDRDLMVALGNARTCGFDVQLIWHKESRLPTRLDLVGIPGGFSFGDYLRCGAIAARSPIMRSVIEFAGRGGYVIGICNGFQILTETGLLPGTLMRNAGMRFLCRETELAVATTESAYTCLFDDREVIRLPIAHHEGNYRTDAETERRLEQEERVAFRYVDTPNGAQADIAGILSPNRRVLGMMPHPERRVDSATGGTDGARMFACVAETLALT